MDVDGQASAAEAAPAPRPPDHGPRRDRRLLAAIAAGAVLLLVIGVLVGRSLGGGDAPSASPPVSGPASSGPASPGPTTSAPSGGAVGSPAPPYTGPTLFGLSVPVGKRGDASTVVSNITQKYGALPIARIFSDGPPPATWQDDSTLAALPPGTSVVYSFKGDASAAAAGDFDEQVRQFVASKPADISLWVAYYHEPEDDIQKGAFTAEQFRAATAHLAPVIRAAGGHPTLILQQFTLQPGSDRDWHDYYSPAVDVIGWDAYNTAGRGASPSYKPAASFVDPVKAVAQETGKPFGWAEFGSPCISSDPDCTGRAAWLDQVSSAFRSSGAQFATYWNRAALKAGGQDYSLSDPDSQSTYRRFLAR